MTKAETSWDGVFFSTEHEHPWKLWGSLPVHSEELLRQQLHLGRAYPPSSESQWLAVAQNPDGTVVATSSAMLSSGFFWSVDHVGADQKRLIIGPNPAEVIRARSEPTHLNHEFIRAYLLGGANPRSTPYLELHRVQPGVVVQWDFAGAQPVEHEWQDFDLHAQPRLEGPAAMGEYLAAFDQTLTDLMHGTSPLAITLSGGLDSTFMAASMALLTSPERPIHAFTHRPHPDAKLASKSSWDPDDSEFALLLEREYPELISVTTVFNEELIQPLDAAHDASEKSWLPTFTPANQIWINEFEQRADALGAKQLFIGQKGNATFSQEPTYAAEFYLSAFRLDKLVELARSGSDDGMSTLNSFRRRIASPLKGRLFSHTRVKSMPSFPPTLSPIKPIASAASAYASRREFVNWLSPATAALAASAHPGGQLVPLVDPFAAAKVVLIASRITPLEWSRGLFPRGFARRAGLGRVPDEVRLRTRRGGQSWDIWFVISKEPERYLDEVNLLSSTPGINEWVDVEAIKTITHQWFTHGAVPPRDADLNLFLRLLATAAFVRRTTYRLELIQRGN